MLQVDDYRELLALNRALMEVRYLAREVDDATRGSSFLSALHERVVEEIKVSLRASGRVEEAAQWECWEDFASRKIEPPLIVGYLVQGWTKLSSPEVKREVVINQLRPFKFSAEDVQRIVQELDRRASDGVSGQSRES